MIKTNKKFSYISTGKFILSKKYKKEDEKENITSG